MRLNNLLVQIVGSSYLYRATAHKINDFRIVGGKVLLSTNLRMLDFPEENFKEIFENEFEKTEDVKTNESNTSLITYKSADGIDIVKTLKDNIEKLGTNKGFVGQATAINKTVNTIINIAKVELQARKLND